MTNTQKMKTKRNVPRMQTWDSENSMQEKDTPAHKSDVNLVGQGEGNKRASVASKGKARRGKTAVRTEPK
jgi:hypothetical protein